MRAESSLLELCRTWTTYIKWGSSLEFCNGLRKSLRLDSRWYSRWGRWRVLLWCLFLLLRLLSFLWFLCVERWNMWIGRRLYMFCCLLWFAFCWLVSERLQGGFSMLGCCRHCHKSLRFCCRIRLLGIACRRWSIAMRYLCRGMFRRRIGLFD